MFKNTEGQIFVIIVLEHWENSGKDIESRVWTGHVKKHSENETLCGKNGSSSVGIILQSLFEEPYAPYLGFCSACITKVREMELVETDSPSSEILEHYPVLTSQRLKENPQAVNRYAWGDDLTFPEIKIPLDLTLTFSVEEFKRVRLGLLPREMEDKWFIYLEDEWLYFHRSWTNICIYQVKFERIDNSYRVVEAWVNGDLEQHEFVDQNYEIELLTFLIYRLLLGRDVPFPSPPEMPGWGFQHGIVGNSRANDED